MGTIRLADMIRRRHGLAGAARQQQADDDEKKGGEAPCDMHEVKLVAPAAAVKGSRYLFTLAR